MLQFKYSIRTMWRFGRNLRGDLHFQNFVNAVKAEKQETVLP